MKNLFIILIFSLSIISKNLFAQEDYQLTKVDKNPVLLGLNFAPGISWQQSTSIIGGENIIQFAMNYGIKGIFNFSSTGGIISAFQINSIYLKQKSDSLTREYSLNYFQLTISPFIRFKDLFFSTGLYLGFILKGEKTENSITEKDNSDYTRPDFGLIISIGYLIKIKKIFHIYLDLKLKYELNSFLKTSVSTDAPRAFALYLDISFMFEVN